MPSWLRVIREMIGTGPTFAAVAGARIIVSALAVIYVMTFFSGFLQDTKYNFFNYIFFFLLFIGGIGLVRVTIKSTQTGPTRGFLFLTATAATLLLIFFIG